MLVGVVGKANVGKSTLFKALTLAEVEIANYPFTTIEKNEGVGFVKVKCAENDFSVKCNPKFGYCMKGWRFVPVKIIDVAGLVPGAHLGKGRGNQFLDDLREADVLIHVVDVSGSSNEVGEPVEPGSYDPVNDIHFLEEEIDMWFMGILKKNWDKFARQVKQEGKQLVSEIVEQFAGLKITEEMISDAVKKLGLPADDATAWGDEELKKFAAELRQQSKPMIIAANKIDVNGAQENLKKMKDEFPDKIIVGCSAESELALKEAAKHKLIDYIPGEGDFEILDEGKLSEKQKSALQFIKDGILKKFGTTGAQQVIDDAVFKLLKNIAVYPVPNAKLEDKDGNKLPDCFLEDKDGNKLPDCFLVPEGCTALDFAFKIHTDIGNNFIKAVDLRTKKVIGKESELKNNDVIEIVTKK
jgi:ribosome-binding ATPase YchF (GTP1/OBG family)